MSFSNNLNLFNPHSPVGFRSLFTPNLSRRQSEEEDAFANQPIYAVQAKIMKAMEPFMDLPDCAFETDITESKLPACVEAMKLGAAAGCELGEGAAGGESDNLALDIFKSMKCTCHPIVDGETFEKMVECGMETCGKEEKKKVQESYEGIRKAVGPVCRKELPEFVKSMSKGFVGTVDGGDESTTITIPPATVTKGALDFLSEAKETGAADSEDEETGPSKTGSGSEPTDKADAPDSGAGKLGLKGVMVLGMALVSVFAVAL